MDVHIPALDGAGHDAGVGLLLSGRHGAFAETLRNPLRGPVQNVVRSATACQAHVIIALILEGKRAPSEINQRLEDGRSRNTPKDHSPMDVASEGQTADARSSSRVCEERSRAEQTSPKPTRPV